MRIIWTRAQDRGVEPRRALEALGHEVICVPLTRIEDGEPFPEELHLFDGVLFTSVAAVERIPMGRTWPTGRTWPRVAAVGTATAAALEARGVAVDVVGEGGGAELAAAWGYAQEQRLLLPQAFDAHPDLERLLREAGADLTTVAVYRTIPILGVERDLFQGADRIEFFAPSAVRAYVALSVETDATFGGVGATTRAAMAASGLTHTGF